MRTERNGDPEKYNSFTQFELERTHYRATSTRKGLCGSDLFERGKVQTAHHILHDCTIFKPPNHIYEADNPVFLEYLVKSKF